MISITVEVNQVQLRHYLKALDDLANRVRYHLTDGGGAMNRRCAMQYATQVVTAITSQKFAGNYRHYVQRYEDWKALMGYAGEGFGKLKGDLIRSLTHYQEAGGWFGGIAKGAKDSGGKSWFSIPGGRIRGESKPISMYAYVMEYGGDYGEGGTHPARAVFTPVMDEFAATTWIEEANVALASIERQWA